MPHVLMLAPPLQVFSGQSHPGMHAMHPVECVTASPPAGNPSPQQAQQISIPQVGLSILHRKPFFFLDDREGFQLQNYVYFFIQIK